MFWKQAGRKWNSQGVLVFFKFDESHYDLQSIHSSVLKKYCFGSLLFENSLLQEIQELSQNDRIFLERGKCFCCDIYDSTFVYFLP